MKAKKKITIELTPKDVETIIIQHFATKKNTIIQDVRFEVGEVEGDYEDRYPSYEFKTVTCTREDTIEI